MSDLIDLVEKKCSKCKKTKLGHEFHKKKLSPDGLQSHCKRCKAAVAKAHHKKYYATIKGRATRLLAGAKTRAKKKGFACTIDHAFVLERLSTGACEITAEIFDLTPGRPGRRKQYAPSLHRLDNTKGYTPENTVLVLWIVNAMLSEYDILDFLFVARKMLEKSGFKVTMPRAKKSRRKTNYRCDATKDFFELDLLATKAA